MSHSESSHPDAADRPVGHDRPGHGHADWEERYAGAPVWSGNPNVALVAEVADLTPGRALDVGCGEGADAIWLAGRGWRVTAIDVAVNALDRARAAGAGAGVDVEWVASGLVELTDRDGCFDLVTVFYPALMRTADRAVESALLGAVAPGGTLLVVHHAEIDWEVARSHGFDPDDYVDHDDVVAALRGGLGDGLGDGPGDGLGDGLGSGWVIERDEQRDRDVAEGAGAHHHRDLLVRARRLDRGEPA